jgi:hypothetical protein
LIKNKIEATIKLRDDESRALLRLVCRELDWIVRTKREHGDEKLPEIQTMHELWNGIAAKLMTQVRKGGPLGG